MMEQARAHTEHLIQQKRFEEADKAILGLELSSHADAKMLWHMGRADLAATILEALPQTPEVRIDLAASLTRSGQGARALEVLGDTPGGWFSLRRANALWHIGDSSHAEAEVDLALAEGRENQDASLTVPAIWQKGELCLEREDGKLALYVLAEGLKISEMLGKEADPYLLAVLSEAHAYWGSTRKAYQTALKALERSHQRHLSFVRTHLALHRADPQHDLLGVLDHVRDLNWPFWEIQIMLRLSQNDPAYALEALEKVRQIGIFGLMDKAQDVVTTLLNHSLNLGEE